MSTAIDVIEGLYFQDLMAQPKALRDTLTWLRGKTIWDQASKLTCKQPWRRILLTGMGSSFHSLHPLFLSLIGAGHNAVLMETSELIHYGMSLCDKETLIVAVSQSGKSAEMVRLLETNHHSAILAVTNTLESPLARRADFAVLTQAGIEVSVSCKTYVGSLLALAWLEANLTGSDEGAVLHRLEPASMLVESYLANWSSFAHLLAKKLVGIEHLFLTGRGRSLAAVGTGALIIKEADHFHAEGMSSAAFRHGPIEMLQESVFTAVFSGDVGTRDLNMRLARQLGERGANCEMIGTDSRFPPFRLPESDVILTPILEILPPEMITLALAGLSKREAGHFNYASKITDTE
jgi:glucosamine--fructose-6-phosphate aminotransferase (isomerizing)